MVTPSLYPTQAHFNTGETTMTHTTMTPEQQLDHAQALIGFSAEISTINPKVLLETVEHTKGELIKIGVEHLSVMPNFNVRLKDQSYFEHIDNLKRSILEEGFYPDKPLAGIAVYQGNTPTIYITDGDCRLQALKLAIQERPDIPALVPVVLKDRTTTMEDLTVAMVRSNDGRRFTPLELSIVAKRLQKYGWAERMIATRMGISYEYVTQLLMASGAPAAIRQMIEVGEVPLAVAVQSMRAHGQEAAKEVLQTAVTQAKERGETKITKKDLPEQIQKKAYIKTAPKMVGIIQKICANEAFQSFPIELREEIAAILAEVTVNRAAGSTETVASTEDAVQSASGAPGAVVDSGHAIA
jgi:ParB family chromosome partitioning protein